jgi:hypothetical protein
VSEYDFLRDLISAESSARQGEVARLSSAYDHLRDRFDRYAEVQEEHRTATRRYLFTTFVAVGGVLIACGAFIVTLIGKLA